MSTFLYASTDVYLLFPSSPESDTMTVRDLSSELDIYSVGQEFV